MSIPNEMVKELQRWHLAREAASRHNRDLLQYGAAFAAVLGIEAGSGGILAVATALTSDGDSLPTEVGAILLAVLAIGVVFAVVSGALLIGAFRRRRAAERRADNSLENLIGHAPERFLPKEEVTPELASENG